MRLKVKNDCRVPRTAHYSKASFATSIGLPCQNSVSNFIKDDKITSFSYDANGNLLSKENAYKSEQYFYNSINRMAQSVVIDTIEKTHTSTQYGYDAFGRRNLVQDQGSSTMRTLYDGFSFDIVQEAEVFQGGDFTTSYMELGSIQYTQTQTGTSRYRYVGDDPKTVTLGDLTQESTRYTGSRATLYANGQAVATNRSASLYDNGRAYFGTDILGSVRSATDDYASLEDRYEYDIFGTPYEGDFTSGLNTGYTGKPYDTVTGLYNYGYRDYSPQQARFTTVDPIRDGNNWFSYVVNDPVNYVDLWGLEASCGSDGKRNYVVVAMFPGGGHENVGTTFVDAAKTRVNDIKNSSTFDQTRDTITMYEIDSIEEFKNVLDNGNIDQLDVFSHSGERHLVVGSGTGPGERELLYESNLDQFNKNAFNKDASINFYGCNTAAENKISVLQKIFGKTTIADSFARYFKGVSVTGFTGGSMAVPSPVAKTDINFIHKTGNPVWYRSASGSKTYQYEK